MNGGSVSENHAFYSGGGITNSGILTINDGYVSNNITGNGSDGNFGAGVYNCATFTMTAVVLKEILHITLYGAGVSNNTIFI
jgi:hypothetical protein